MRSTLSWLRYFHDFTNLVLLMSLVLVKVASMFIESRFNLDLLQGNIPFALLLLAGISLLGFASGLLLQVQAYFRNLLVSARNTSGGAVLKRGLNKGLIVFLSLKRPCWNTRLFVLFRACWPPPRG